MICSHENYNLSRIITGDVYIAEINNILISSRFIKVSFNMYYFFDVTLFFLAYWQEESISRKVEHFFGKVSELF